jgi:hypothetical protein
MIPTRKKPRQWLVPAIAAATIVAAPLMVFGLAGEGDRWTAARLMESYLDGNRAAAIDGLAAIVARQPDNLALKTRLARWMLDNSREREALDLLETIPQNARTSQVDKMICDGLIATDRPREALHLWRELNPATAERSQEERLRHLNDLAYRMALAKSELPVARSHIEQVIVGRQSEWHALVKDELDFSGQVIIAATLLLRGDGSFRENGSLWHTARHRESLEKMLTPPIEEIRSMLSDPIVMAEESARFEQSGHAKDKSIKVKDSESPPDPETRLKSILSSLLTARALVYQDLGETDRSQADRTAVLELGHDPQVIADAWPSVTSCAGHLISLTAALDTRACVLYFSGAADKALHDLNLAIAGHEALLHGSFTVARAIGFDSVDPREINVEHVELLKRTLAAVYFHRSWVWQALADLDGAAADVRRVRELGFRPGPGLF